MVMGLPQGHSAGLQRWLLPLCGSCCHQDNAAGQSSCSPDPRALLTPTPGSCYSCCGNCQIGVSASTWCSAGPPRRLWRRACWWARPGFLGQWPEWAASALVLLLHTSFLLYSVPGEQRELGAQGFSVNFSGFHKFMPRDALERKNRAVPCGWGLARQVVPLGPGEQAA